LTAPQVQALGDKLGKDGDLSLAMDLSRAPMV
jgi:hypothetical protein